ncbi:MAG: thiol-disulfide oxidoreductase DCC family protein [Gammaproteobacteria bacterium]
MNSSEGNIVVFDGLCNLCSASVRFILEYDRRGAIRFAPMQSPLGHDLLQRHGIDPADAHTFLLLRGTQAFVQSDAALEIARDLGRWRWLRVLRVIPRGLRNRIYGVIARHRYRWFGKRDTCFVPTDEQRARFLDGLEARSSQTP